MFLFRSLILLLSFCLSGYACLAQAVPPIPFAHAHNDYVHKRPLLDALDHGFTSIEVDVHAIDGELYVYHDQPTAPDPARTLKKLYLEPLRQRVTKHKGMVYSPGGAHFQLMIDIKTEAETTYTLINQQLAEYSTLFSRIENGMEVPGPVMVFLSGNRPMKTILNSTSHIARLDGRPDDLGKGYAAEQVPVISERYGKVLQWDGSGKMPAKERRKLRKLCKQVHREGKQLRLWAMPASEHAWATYLKAGIDWINADDLARVKKFYEEHGRKL